MINPFIINSSNPVIPHHNHDLRYQRQTHERVNERVPTRDRTYDRQIGPDRRHWNRPTLHPYRNHEGRPFIAQTLPAEEDLARRLNRARGKKKSKEDRTPRIATGPNSMPVALGSMQRWTGTNAASGPSGGAFRQVSLSSGPISRKMTRYGLISRSLATIQNRGRA